MNSTAANGKTNRGGAPKGNTNRLKSGLRAYLGTGKMPKGAADRPGKGKRF